MHEFYDCPTQSFLDSDAPDKCINNVLIRNMIFCIVFMITKEHYITISEQLG